MKAKLQTSEQDSMMKQAATERFLALELPSLRSESYRYFPIQHFSTRKPESQRHCKVSDWSESTVQVSDGMLSFNSEAWAEQGLEVSSLSDNFWMKPTEAFEKDYFYQWMMQDSNAGVLFRVKENRQVETPLHLQFSFTLNDSQRVHRVLYLESGSSLKLIEEWDVCSESEHAWLGSSLQVILEPGASLEWQQIERGQCSATRIERQEVWLNGQSSLRQTQIPSGFHRNQTRSYFHLLGDKSSVDAKTAVIGWKNSAVQWWVDAFHKGKESFCRSDFWGVAQDRSKLIFDAMIEIPFGAPKVESHQLSKTLLLSSKASVHNLPRLKIATDDVKVSHGASVSSFEEDQLYYLESRGISRERARQLIVEAFIDPVVESLFIDELKADLKKELKPLIKGFEERDV